MGCDAELRSALEALYEDLAREIDRAGPVCRLSGRCCRFEQFGHTLFLSNLETELLLDEGIPAERPLDAAGCPFQQGRVCTARERRPLGCRVFFCEPNYCDEGSRIGEEYVGRLKRLAERLGRPWRYGPLHVMLQRALGQAEIGDAG